MIMVRHSCVLLMTTSPAMAGMRRAVRITRSTRSRRNRRITDVPTFLRDGGVQISLQGGGGAGSIICCC